MSREDRLAARGENVIGRSDTTPKASPKADMPLKASPKTSASGVPTTSLATVEADVEADVEATVAPCTKRPAADAAPTDNQKAEIRPPPLSLGEPATEEGDLAEQLSAENARMRLDVEASNSSAGPSKPTTLEAENAQLRQERDALLTLIQQAEQGPLLPRLPPRTRNGDYTPGRRNSLPRIHVPGANGRAPTPPASPSYNSNENDPNEEPPDFSLLLEELPGNWHKSDQCTEQVRQRWKQYIALQEYLQALRKLDAQQERDRRRAPKGTGPTCGDARTRLQALFDQQRLPRLRLIRSSQWISERPSAKVGTFEREHMVYGERHDGDERVVVLANLVEQEGLSVSDCMSVLRRVLGEAAELHSLQVAGGVVVAMDCDGAALGDSSMGRLLSVLHTGTASASTAVEELYLNDNELTKGAMGALRPLLAGEGGARTSHLDLSRNDLRCPGMVELARGLTRDCVLLHLVLRDNDIEERGIRALADAMTAGGLPQLLSLNLRQNTAGDEGIEVLCGALVRHSSLTALDIRENGFTSTATLALASLLEGSHSLRTLWVCRNDLMDEGAAILAGALATNTMLRSITMTSSKIGNDGCQALLSTMKVNQSIIELDLRENGMHASKLQVIEDKLDANRQRVGSDTTYVLPARLKSATSGMSSSVQKLATDMARSAVKSIRSDSDSPSKSTPSKPAQESEKTDCFQASRRSSTPTAKAEHSRGGAYSSGNALLSRLR